MIRLLVFMSLAVISCQVNAGPEIMDLLTANPNNTYAAKVRQVAALWGQQEVVQQNGENIIIFGDCLPACSPGLSFLGSTLIKPGTDLKIESVIIVIYVDLIKISNSNVEKVLSHEIGHALGFGHSNDLNDVMHSCCGSEKPSGQEVSSLKFDYSVLLTGRFIFWRDQFPDFRVVVISHM